ncbi:cell envelope integrity protein TolA, partial [Candidatus Woesearchaeota archaeon]|nr:cell envelope integrity protein TolA [Candidatus Woesearchaeota archaeon]
GRQDSNEDGVDCGGVCEVSCTETTPEDPEDPDEIPDNSSLYLDSDEDGLPDSWEEEHFGCTNCADPNSDPDGDEYNNLEEYYGDSDPNDASSLPDSTSSVPEEKHTVGIILLIVGLLFMLGGAGYLIYDAKFVEHPTTPPPGQAFTPPQPSLSPEEKARLEKQRQEAIKKRQALQAKQKTKSQTEKARARSHLLSSFSNDKMAEHGKIIKKKGSSTPITTPKLPTTKKPAVEKIVKSQTPSKI